MYVHNCFLYVYRCTCRRSEDDPSFNTATSIRNLISHSDLVAMAVVSNNWCLMALNSNAQIKAIKERDEEVKACTDSLCCRLPRGYDCLLTQI